MKVTFRRRLERLETAKEEAPALFDLLPSAAQAITTREDLEHWKAEAPACLQRDRPALALWCALCGVP